MDERAALALVGEHLDAAGDDCAVVDDLVVTTDMLHETTDFPGGTTRYTAGWRAVAASLSDVAAMGARALAAVAAYGAPEFRAAELEDFVRGAVDVCDLVGAEYVGGDLDDHDEFTVASTAVGRTDDPVLRSGATPGDEIYVTGTFGRSAAALRLFEEGDVDRANELFRFEPRVAAGEALAGAATAMMDSSDGLARSLHQLAAASGCGFAVSFDALPVHPAVDELADDADRRELATTFGEDFELVFTVPAGEVPDAGEDCPATVAKIGTVVEEGVSMDGKPLGDRGYTH